MRESAINLSESNKTVCMIFPLKRCDRVIRGLSVAFHCSS